MKALMPKGATSRRRLSVTASSAALEAHYKTLVRYLNLTDMGMVLGYGCGTPSMTEHSKFPQQAYQLGNRL